MIHAPHISYNFYFKFSAEDEITTFMMSLCLQSGVSHTIRRALLYEDVIDLYSNKLETILSEFPFRVGFEGELAIDTGGVTRDMISAFFEEMYIKHFDGAALLVPLDIPNVSAPPFSVLGAIFSHAYLAAGMLPVKIAFPTLASILLPASTVGCLPDDLLLETFLDSLSPHDYMVCKDALKIAQRSDEYFSSALQMNLVTVLSRYTVRETPKPHNLLSILVSVAKHHFLRKPAYFVSEMRAAFPAQHIPFWSLLSYEHFYDIYRAQQASASKVLALIEDPQTSNPNEERVYGYLQQFIGSLRGDELRSLLRFATGSSVCGSSITVCFNNLQGLARRPTSHTCSHCLELPSAYSSYGEFQQEFLAVLNGDEWCMDAI